ncbi:hypothetical protein B296_00014974 [Ensete ventricosum]|uniref:BHLH domain-containing protein n=1 Tax=Ensete ventricosum TaxID=4639 RepID=A0A426Z4X1_ENSVE|nr:hypothetical protein B296_00014974 [Ensete ventricosum]
MKALQELIPHCNKTDKASMLDEAIEYLKSLQLQVQVRKLERCNPYANSRVGDAHIDNHGSIR